MLRHIFTFFLILMLFSANLAYAIEEEKSYTISAEESSWDKRAYINGFYTLAGLFSAELEFGATGKWTNSIGAFYIGQDLLFLEQSVAGFSYRWNYYTATSTSHDSWVFGIGLSVVLAKIRFLYAEEDGYGVVPELNAGYKWNFEPISLLLGLGYGAANAGIMLNVGYSF